MSTWYVRSLGLLTLFLDPWGFLGSWSETENDNICFVFHEKVSITKFISSFVIPLFMFDVVEVVGVTQTSVYIVLLLSVLNLSTSEVTFMRDEKNLLKVWMM